MVCDRHRLQQVPAGDLGHERAYRHHGSVRVLGVLRGPVCAVSEHLGVPRQHLRPGDAYIVETECSIVRTQHALERLGSQLVDFAARHELLRVEVAQLYQEQVVAVIFAVDDQPSNHDPVRGPHARGADPVLCAADGRRVDHELIRLRVKGRRGLDALDIGPVAQFGLAVRTKDFESFRLRDPDGLLLVRHLPFEVGHED